MTKAAASAATFIAIAFIVNAQTLSPGEVRVSSRPYKLAATIRMESRLVQLEVVVRDLHGRAISGLTRDDFAIYDSGKSRELTAFPRIVSTRTSRVFQETRRLLQPREQQPMPSICPSQARILALSAGSLSFSTISTLPLATWATRKSQPTGSSAKRSPVVTELAFLQPRATALHNSQQTPRRFLPKSTGCSRILGSPPADLHDVQGSPPMRRIKSSTMTPAQ